MASKKDTKKSEKPVTTPAGGAVERLDEFGDPIEGDEDAGEEASEEEGEEEGEEEPAPTALTAEEKRKLFVDYATAKSKADVLEGQLTTAKKTQSDAVHKILKALGKGPFQVSSVPALAGKKLVIVRRGDTFFFRSEEAQVTDI